ncbi:MAG: methyltransferase domain-containing protein [Acidovorax sp.]|uniref:methyltransferase domain-containing protein n=1 Tax=Acidovorax sp. TaxID=1872122 RepID=UPI0039191ECE
MTNSIDDLHVYLRSIAEGERTSLSVLAGLVHEGATILDLGCGSGALGQHLKETRRCTSDGVTLSQAEADHARPHYRRVEVDDLETADLRTMFGGQQYDYIVCADVLEHLRRPEQVLLACRDLLVPSGRLLISVPNAGYSGLVAELLEGEFRYRDEGLLDRTHLRFFTRRSLLRFLTEQRWSLDSVDTVTRPLPESEFQVAFDQLPPSVARHLLGTPDALTYQFICAAHPVEQAPALPGSAAAPNVGAEPARALFTAQLYLGQDGNYREDCKLTVAGVIGQQRQTLLFELPSKDLPTTRLRLDPADRPGFVHLHSLHLHTASGETLWQWSADADGSSMLAGTLHQQIVWQAPFPAASGILLLLTGDEPWFELPVAPDALARAPREGLRLSVELGWPMSADYAALAGTVSPMLEEQHFLRSQVGRIPHLMQEHEKLALEHTQLHHLHAELHRQLAAEQRERHHLFAERDKAQQEITQLHGQLRGMAAHVDNLSNLRSVRYTRALSRWLRPSRIEPVQASAALTSAAQAAGSTPILIQDATTAPAPMRSPISDTVDIIVPVYRGLADTQLCVESTLASPVTAGYRLIIINDASPEPAVTQWLREKAAQEPRITLLENEHNLGFVGTVNRGMKHSQHNDVVLLNSDTEVANDWLDRLRRTAYASTKSGTVTPFSSNATICSYPVFCAANPLPDGHTTASLDRLFAAANAGQAIDVPTGVGFCMYIRRDCLKEVGWFDEEHFGKGYGEENDFCQRALTLGWRNLHALDTYVLHTGGVSFGESKSPREQAAMATLRKLHPSYEPQVMAFVQQDPACAARLAVDWLRETRGGSKPVVLAVQHARGGGTERHVLELAQTLAGKVTFLSLRPSGSHHVVLQLVATNLHPPEGQASQQPISALSDTWRAVFDLNEEQPQLLELLRTVGVAHVHFHHLLGHHQFSWHLPQALDVGYDFTSHDFYSFCTNITLTGKINRYQADKHGECCDGTHPPSMPPVAEQITDWRIRNRIFLEGARFVLSPSLDTAQRMLAAFPSARVRFAPHTDLDHSAHQAPQPRRLQPQQPLRIAVIGALSIIKGAEVLEATARLAQKNGSPLEFHLIGYGYRHLQTSGTALTVHGEYEEAQLPALLQRLAPDVVWFPALWPETYSYTLSAALEAALPVVVPDLGAFVERVAHRPWSWVQDWSSTPQQWVDLFAHIREQFIDSSAAAALTTAAPAAPDLPQPLATLQEKLGPWSYPRDYLAFIPEAPAAPADANGATAAAYAPKAQQIARQFVAAQANSSPQVHTGGLLYRGALRLQRMPMLGSVMRAVPQSWRYRVKRLLSR